MTERTGGAPTWSASPAPTTPLLLPRLEALAPWPVAWIDPAPAIARRVVQLIGPAPREADRHGAALGAFTAGTCLTDPLRAALASRGIGEVGVEAIPLPLQ